MTKKPLYSGVALCQDLSTKLRCFRIRKFSEVEYNVIFHEHVPKHRISQDNAREFMKALMVRQRSLKPADILRGYLNKRGKEPSAIPIGMFKIEYPERGVLRVYLSYRDIEIMFDEVVSAEKFRKQQPDT